MQWTPGRLDHLLIPAALGALLALLPAARGWAGIPDMASAIDKAGGQRMLTQRVVKAYCLVGMDVQRPHHQKQLVDAIALFEVQLGELEALASDPEIKAALKQVEMLWKPFARIAGGPVTKAGAVRLMGSSDQVLAAAHQVVLLLEQSSGSNLGHLVNLAGRQRMLTQRMAKAYMARAWGLDDPAIGEQMKQAEDEFEDAMDRLESAEENTPDIQKKLQEARKQWRVVEGAVALDRQGRHIPLLMANTSEKLLQLMNTVTGLYVQLGKGK